MNQDDINRKRVADLTCLSKDATELAYYDHAIDKTKIRYGLSVFQEPASIERT